MTREEAKNILLNAAWLGTNADRERIEEAVRVAVETLIQPEIIRCKDCRHNSNCEIQYSAQAGELFFCGGAEGRTDEA